jgi:hypothetical protein
MGVWFRSLLVASSLTAGLLAAGTVQAQSSFSFSIGTGHYGHRGHHGHHHHHHDWCHGPYWGPGWYGPGFGVVYAPPPVVKERVIYVQPQQPAWTPAPASVTAAPAAPAAPIVANTLPASSSEDDRIVIRNMSSAGLPVAFLVDGQDVELSDGATRTFVGRPRRSVAYDRGGRFGSTEQQLTAGQYEFRNTASGWDLVRRPDLTPSGRTAVRSNSLPPGR